MSSKHSSTAVSMAGYLRKKSYFLNAPRERWMVIRGDYLYSYKTEQMRSAPTEIFDLNSFFLAVVATEGNYELGQFELIGLDDTRVLIAPSLHEMNEWITRINAIITANTSQAYISKICSSVVSFSNKQKRGLQTFSDLSAMGFNNDDLCLMAACKHPKNSVKARNYIADTLSTEAIVLREHAMQKKSKWMGRWRERWTVLMFEPYSNLCFLATYRTRQCYASPTEFFLLTERIEVRVDADDETRFRVLLNDKDETRFAFKAESARLRDEWAALLVSRRRNWTALRSVEEQSAESGDSPTF